MHVVQAVEVKHVLHCGMSNEHASHLPVGLIPYVLVKHLVHTVAEEHLSHWTIRFVQSSHLLEVDFTAYKLLMHVRQVLQLEHVAQFVIFTLQRTHDDGVIRQ